MQVRQQVDEEHAAATFGESLRRQRELRGITLREISHATKISVSHLTALEKDDFESLPGGAFTRGFLRAYAGHVGLDGEEMVNHYLLAVAGRSEMPLEVEPSSGGAEAGRRLRILAAGGVVLAVAAVAWYFLGA